MTQFSVGDKVKLKADTSVFPDEYIVKEAYNFGVSAKVFGSTEHKFLFNNEIETVHVPLSSVYTGEVKWAPGYGTDGAPKDLGPKDQVIFQTEAYGNDKESLEQFALARAREFYGPVVTLAVLQDYRAFGNDPHAYEWDKDGKFEDKRRLNRETKFHAGNYVRVVVVR